MSVKPPPFPKKTRSESPWGRLIGFLLADWWIDAVLMLFIVISMLFLHH